MSFGSPIMQAFAIAARKQAETPPVEPIQTEATVPTTPTTNDSAAPTTQTEIAPAKRRLQCVNTKSAKVKVLTWMQDRVAERGTEKHLMSNTVQHFSNVFRADGYQATLMKVRRWWNEREQLFEDYEWDQMSFSHTYPGWRKRVECKARPGKGRKTFDWNVWLYPLVRAEFERLRKSGVKFSPDVLLQMARNVLLQSRHPTFTPSTILPGSGKTILDSVTARWVQQFQEVQGIVPRAQTGKKQVSDEKQEQIERATAYHMGQVARGFASGELNEDLLENMDETHFVVNMDNGKTLGFRGDTEVKYADVVSGGIGITMALKLTGGRTAKICTPMMIFQNNLSSYPIRGTPDNVVGVCYRSSPSSFMTSELLTEYYNEPQVSWADPSGRTKIQYIDNYPGHNVIQSCTEALARIRTELRYFPANSTHLTQPCDSFVISKIKDAWQRRWEAKKMNMIASHMWQGDGRDGTSGHLKNPGWSYFLQLAADAVRDVNAQTDAHYGISYARKAMIQCGLSLNLDGNWDVKQLTPELQRCIAKYRQNFEGSLKGLQPATRPQRVRRAGRGQGRGADAGTGRGQGRATSDAAIGSGAGRGRRSGQGRGRSQASSHANPDPQSEVAPSGTAALGSTVAATWATTRLGARIHRRQARQRSTNGASSSHIAVPVAVAEQVPDSNGSGRNEEPVTDVPRDAEGPEESVDIDAIGELSLDSEVWGFLESQYPV